MTEMILLLLAGSMLSINICMVAMIFKMLFSKEKMAAQATAEEITDQRRKELEYQEWKQEGLDNIMSYDGSPKRKERDIQ